MRNKTQQESKTLLLFLLPIFVSTQRLVINRNADNLNVSKVNDTLQIFCVILQIPPTGVRGRREEGSKANLQEAQACGTLLNFQVCGKLLNFQVCGTLLNFQVCGTLLHFQV